MRVIRVDETQSERAARLRREMHAVGTQEPEPPAPPPPVTHDGPPQTERKFYESMSLDDVFTAEAKALLALPMTGQTGTATLWPKDRAQILKAIVAFRAMQQKIGPIWGASLDEPEEEGA